MSEGTAREVVARALMDHAVAQNPGLEHFAEGILAHMYHGWADAVLAALAEAGALAPAGPGETYEAMKVAEIAIKGWIDGLKDNGTAKDVSDAAELQRSLDVVQSIKHALVAPAADAATGAPS